MVGKMKEENESLRDVGVARWRGRRHRNRQDDAK
jgi:hypothetical protein